MNHCHGLALIAAAALGAGCLGSSAHKSIDCGTGDGVVYQGADFCVYAAPLIIEGFLCPEAVPFQFPGDGGAVICSGESELPPDDIEAIIDLWHQGTTGTPDATGSDVLAVPDSWIGDTLPPADTAAPEDTGPNPTPDFCEAALAGDVGASVPVGDGSCTVTATCDAGRVVDCAGDARFCRCDHGDVTCTAATACVPIDQAIGATCDPSVGTGACAERGYCVADTKKCAQLPAPCSERSCYDSAECAADAPGRCYGGDGATGTEGWCAPATTAPLCRDAADCAAGWSCAGSTVACDACGTCDARDGFGTCTSAGDAGPALVLDPAHPLAAAPPGVSWWNGGGETFWIDCASWHVAVRDELTHEWTVGADETGCTANYLRPIYAGQALAAGSVALDLSGAPYLWVRAEGSYYTGCTGFEPSTCAAGPIAITSERVLLR